MSIGLRLTAVAARTAGGGDGYDPRDTESDGYAGSVEDHVIEILSWLGQVQPAVGRANLLALAHVVNYSFSPSRVPSGMRLTLASAGCFQSLIGWPLSPTTVHSKTGQRTTRSRGGAGMAPKKPTKKQLSDAGKALQNPRTPEKKESGAARVLRKGRKKP